MGIGSEMRRYEQLDLKLYVEKTVLTKKRVFLHLTSATTLQGQ